MGNKHFPFFTLVASPHLFGFLVDLLRHCTTVFSKTFPSKLCHKNTSDLYWNSSLVWVCKRNRKQYNSNTYIDLKKYQQWTMFHFYFFLPVVNTKTQQCLVPKHNQHPEPHHVIQVVLMLQLFTDHSWPAEQGWSHPGKLITSGQSLTPLFGEQATCRKMVTVHIGVATTGNT